MARGINKSEKKKKAETFCYIDCRIDTSLTNDFLNLNIWGKAVYRYVVETAIKSNVFDQIIVVTDSMKIEKSLGNEEGICVQSDFVFPKSDSVICVLSGRAVMLRSNTLKKACSLFCSGTMYSSISEAKYDFLFPCKFKSFISGYNSRPENIFAFYQINNGEIKDSSISTFQLNRDEALVINTVNDFELSIIFKKKEEKKRNLTKAILERIEEKKGILSSGIDGETICLVGHSQIDYWKIENLAGYKVKNCGIAGISSFEYEQYILSKGMLDCSSDIFVIMHGTNDIVMDRRIDEIVFSIQETIFYIREKNKKALIYFISCLHTNGRLDRDNRRIDELNSRLEKVLGNVVNWINTEFMDDEFGELDIRYTIDGLHLSNKGYKILQDHIETRLIEDM